MLDRADTELRKFLGPTLQTASLRAVLVIVALAVVGSGVAYLLH